MTTVYLQYIDFLLERELIPIIFVLAENHIRKLTNTPPPYLFSNVKVTYSLVQVMSACIGVFACYRQYYRKKVCVGPPISKSRLQFLHASKIPPIYKYKLH